MWITLVFLIISLGCIWIYTQNRKKKIISHWQNTLAINKHLIIFKRLYANIDGFALSKAARAEQDALEYVYGEIEFEPFIALLSLCHPDSSTVFYDLGSGTGKAVLACAMVFNVRKSCGIEIFSSLCQCAELQRQHLREIADYRNSADHIEFRQANFLSAQFADASLIFINATAFFGETWAAISTHLEQIKSGALVISTSKVLLSKQFIQLRSTKVLMSWGIVDAFIQQRK